MRITSFDIGVKHLSFCTLDFDVSGHSIHEWQVLNVLSDSINKCEMLTNKAEVCDKDATYESRGRYCCSKKGCLKRFEELLPVSQNPRTELKKKKILKFSLFDICSSIRNVLDKYIECIKTSDIVVLENQPVLKNPTMKSIQMFIYSYCLLNDVKNIALFNANKKLNIYDGPEIDTKGKSGYTLRKYQSIEYTKYFLMKYGFEEKLVFFNSHKKMDDLADSYLQCLTYQASINKKKTK
jgi:hypothetical protein